MSKDNQGSSLLERLSWVILTHKNEDPANIARAVINEIEDRHRIINPDLITENMLEACFSALLEHYDPPDMTRRPWHALKAKRRFTAMVKAAPRVVEK